MKFIRLVLVAVLLANLPLANAASIKSITFTAEIWADNWFAIYVNGKKVGEDSVPITTQRSFNSEVIKFSATYPMTIGFVAKDYVQSNSGLEYLGLPNQQIGDGGLIFQITETASKKLVAVSDSSWKMKVANTAPTNPDCEKSNQPDIDCKFLNFAIPSNWSSSSFNDKSWANAKLFTAVEVGPKDGYSLITWNQSAKFIWGNNLKLDNVVYFRKNILKASSVKMVPVFDFSVTSSTNGSLNSAVTCDGAARSPAISWVGVPESAKSLVLIMDTIPGPPRPGETQTGNHYYITQINIPPTKLKFNEGEINPYSPPCSQGPGTKEYRFFMFALDKLLPSDQKIDSGSMASLMALLDKESIAKASHIYTYARSA